MRRKRRQRSLRRNAGSLIGLFIVLCGLLLFLYPDIQTFLLEQQTQREIRTFQEIIDHRDTDPDCDDEQPEDDADNGTGGSEESGGQDILTPSAGLWAQITDYNQRIYLDHQKGFKDAWSVTQAPEILKGVDDQMFGYIEIPAMEVSLPLYIGASAQHMAKGAAVLGETSIPIGGMDTNAAIAGHRGWRGGPYFREIEKMQVGDLVYLTNPWETLVYRACEIRIIDPTDSYAVKIQDGRDMITLITCHPYRSGGKYRYLVYCERTEEGADDTGAEDHVQSKQYLSVETQGEIPAEEISSQADLNREELLRHSGLAIILLMGGCMMFRSLAERAANQRKKGVKRK